MYLGFHVRSFLLISPHHIFNLVPRAHVPFGQHQDTELWNNQQARFLDHFQTKSLQNVQKMRFWGKAPGVNGLKF